MSYRLERVVAYLLFEIALAFVFVSIGENRSEAQDSPPIQPDLSKLPNRELHVPVKELQVLLTGPNQRVIMTRGEYEKLLQDAKLTPEAIQAARQSEQALAGLPTAIEMLHANHSVRVESGRAIIDSEYHLELLKDSWLELPLEFANVQLISASVDQQTAWLRKLPTDAAPAVLLCRGKGDHTLKLRTAAVVVESSAQQSFSVVLPSSTSANWTMKVPGNVEILAGANVSGRSVDTQANLTEFQFVPVGDPAKPYAASLNVTLSLNNKLAKDQALVDVRSQQLVQIATSVESVGVFFHVRVLQGGESKFAVEIPDGFEIQSVDSPWMARWGIENPEADEHDKAKKIVVDFREPVTDLATISVRATRSKSAQQQSEERWRLPLWKVLDVSRHDSLVYLGISESLQWRDVDSEQLIPIRFEALAELQQKLPLQSSEIIRPIFAGYAPNSEHKLSAVLQRVQTKPQIESTWIMDIAQRELTMSALIAIKATRESLDRVELKIPREWRVQSVTDSAGKTLVWEKQAAQNQVDFETVSLKLPQLLKPQQSTSVSIVLASSPEGWLASWQENRIHFPKLEIANAQTVKTVISASARDDMTLEETDVSNLDPLLLAERTGLGLPANSADSLAYLSLADNWKLSVMVKRLKPMIIAEVVTYANAAPYGIKIQHELLIKPERAKIEEVRFELPDSTPSEVSILFAGGTAVKGFSQSTADGRRTWTVKLPQLTLEPSRLLVEYRLPATQDERPLPVPKILDAAYQSGLVAVDRDDAMEVLVRTQLRRADIGELTDSTLAVGANFLGVFGYAAYQAVQPEVTLKSVLRELSYVPTSIAQSMTVHSWLSDQGWSYHQATFTLRTATNKLAVRLADEVELWAVTIDGRPSLPQRDGDLVIIELPVDEITFLPHQMAGGLASKPTTASTLRGVVLTYAQPIAGLGLRSTVRLTYPELVQRSAGQQMAIPIADVRWTVHTPLAYQLTKIDGGIADLQQISVGFPWNVGRVLVDSGSSLLSKFRLPAKVLGADRGYLAPSSMANLPATLAPLADESMESSAGTAAPGFAQPKPAEQADPFSDQLQATNSELPNVQLQRQPQLRRQSEARRSLQVAVDSADGWNSVDVVGFAATQNVRFKLVQIDRWSWLAYSMVALNLALFLSLWRKPLLVIWRAAVIIMTLAVITALVAPGSDAIKVICAGLFWSTIVLVAIRFMVAFAKLLTRQKVTQVSLSSLVYIAAWMGVSSTAGAAPQQNQAAPVAPEAATVEQMLNALRKVATGDQPVRIPLDAIVVPYSPEDRFRPRSSDERLLVPLSTFEYLQSIVRGTNKPDSINQMVLGGMEYRLSLDSAEFLDLDGTMSVLNSSADAKPLPLAIAGAALLEATLNSAPAAVYAMGENLAVNVPPSDQNQTLRVKIRTKISAQAGWQSVQATIPSAVATQMVVTIPSKETDVRWMSNSQRQQLTTGSDGQILEAGITGGQLSIQWRPKISQVVTDQSLEVQVTANISLLEKATAIDNQFQLSFRRGRRDDFLVVAPKGYRVEKVIGDNIRSWSVEEVAEGQQIRITLLKTALDKEQFRISASRQLDLQQPTEQEVNLPTWKVPDASVTRGQIHLFASKNLAVSVRSTEGLSREDISATSSQKEHAVAINPVSAFRYSGSDQSLSVAVKSAPTKFLSNSVIEVFVYRGELNIEANYSISFVEGESSQVQLSLPSGWKWELGTNSVGLELEVNPEQTGESVSAIVRSREPMPRQMQFTLLGKQSRDTAVPLVGSETLLPVLRVLDSWADRGNIVLWADRGLEAIVTDLTQCSLITNAQRTNHRQRTSMEQKAAVQFALQSPSEDQKYSGRIRWQARKPIVETVSVCNAKLTKQSIEQTIFIEWLIREAGISEVSFVLPSSMKDANIAAQMARKITRTPLNQDQSSPIQITIQLQDQILGEYRVLVQNDLPWSNQTLSVPLVSGMSGSVRHQFVTLENSGFDELVIDAPVGMQPLVRGDSYWNEFSKIFGERAQAYRLADQFNVAEPFSADQPKLSFSTRARSTVQTVNARIGLASTVLSVDAEGNYRGTVEYRTENFSEPFLEIELPAESQLWSVYVADAPVKPGKSDATPSKSSAGRYRIPLVRTQLGDLDYGIRLVYAGKLSISGFWSSVEVPFIRSINVQPEQSQLRLHLPPSLRWYRWEGTLGQVQDEQDLTAGWLSFRTDQLASLSSLLARRSSGEFSQSRAVENIKRLNDSVQLQMQVEQSKGIYNERLLDELGKNSAVVEEARKQQTIVEQEELKSNDDNRLALGNLFLNQSNKRANGNNFLEQSPAGPRQPTLGQPSISGKPDQADKSLGTVQIPQTSTQQAYSQSVTPPFQNTQQAVPFNQDRQQSDAKQMAQRYRSKIQSQSAQESNAQYGGLQNDLAINMPPAPANSFGRGGRQSETSNMGGSGGANFSGDGGLGGQGGFGGGGFGGQGQPSAGRVPASGPNGPTAGSGRGNESPNGLAGAQATSNLPATAQVPTDSFVVAPNMMPQINVAASGLRSIDVQVPVRGTEYLFVTPKGEMQLVAHGISTSKLQEWALAIGALMLMVVLTRKWKR